MNEGTRNTLPPNLVVLVSALAVELCAVGGEFAPAREFDMQHATDDKR